MNIFALLTCAKTEQETTKKKTKQNKETKTKQKSNKQTNMLLKTSRITVQSIYKKNRLINR